jgi:ubiquinone/menaquinone biosynthesis C-methylase UbiE
MKAEFDQFAKTYREEQTDGHSFLTGENSYYFAQLKAKKLKEWIPNLQPKTILDFGCGDGVMTEEIRLKYPKSTIHGVDPSEESIIIAQKNFPKISFQKSSTNLKMFKDNTFDLITCAGVFHHIPFKEHHSYMQELIRTLAPNGTIIFFELNPLNPGTWYIFRHHPMEVNAKMLTPWYAKKLFGTYGSTTYLSYSFFPHSLRWLRPLEPYITKIPFGGLYAVVLKTN